ncbi:glycosyltransferase [uncultured Draconibacterium sp.]|uniref:glycosyltransferase family 2 protein n=1 Tax=uncultured Draconibacterium sp. TaxID=1573823 RepID=UPI003217FBD0
MTSTPIISVIMSVYNAEKYLSESINSILNQTFKNFEFIIIDDKSSDKSVEIINSMASKDSRIKFIQNKVNQGLTINLNTAINIAKGKYIARMDADDISEVHRFEQQLDFLRENPHIDILGSFCKNINQNGEVISYREVPTDHLQITKILPSLNPIAHPTVIFKTDTLKAIGAYDEQYRTSQDYFLWFKAVGAHLHLHNIPSYLLYYRMDDNYKQRKSFSYRWNEIKIKLNGYKLIKHPWYKYYSLLVSIALAFLPSFLFSFLKKFDPR